MDARTTQERVIEVTRKFVEQRGGASSEVGLDSAICQDLLIFGVDVEDYVWALEREFGQVVWTVPWLDYTDQTGSFRGCGCLFLPIWLVGQLGRKILRGGPLIPRPDPRNFPDRLTLRAIAAAIDLGGGTRDWRP